MSGLAFFFQNGSGTPPSSIEYTATEFDLGILTFELTVNDTLGLSATDSDSIQVNEINNIELYNDTGLFTGPPGAEIEVTFTLSGFETGTSDLIINSLPDQQGTPIYAASVCLNNMCGSTPPSVTGTFTMPASGEVYIEGLQTDGLGGGPTSNGSFFTLTYLSEQEGAGFNTANPYPN